MQYRRIGALEVSVVGLGGNSFGTGNAGGTYFGALANGGGTLNLTKTGTGSQIIAGPASWRIRPSVSMSARISPRSTARASRSPVRPHTSDISVEGPAPGRVGRLHGGDHRAVGRVGEQRRFTVQHQGVVVPAVPQAGHHVVELGRADTPGRPYLYGTGFEFLERFGLASVEELPPLDVEVASRLAEEGGEAARRRYLAMTKKSLNPKT